MKKFIFTAVFLLGISFAYSQNFTYSELMRLSKIERWSEIERFLSAREYKYAGSIERDDHKTATWTYNCPDFKFTEEGIDFSIGKNGSIISIQDYYEDAQKCYELVLPSEEAYNLFMKTAINNNFTFYEDGINADEIFEQYIRKNQFRTEYMKFIKKKNGFFMVYYEP